MPAAAFTGVKQKLKLERDRIQEARSFSRPVKLLLVSVKVTRSDGRSRFTDGIYDFEPNDQIFVTTGFLFVSSIE